MKQEHRRRHAYIIILRARTYFVEGDFDYAANLALDAATSCLAIQSKSNLADLTRFYASLTQTSFKYAPTTVQLGVILRATHTRYEHSLGSSHRAIQAMHYSDGICSMSKLSQSSCSLAFCMMSATLVCSLSGRNRRTDYRS